MLHIIASMFIVPGGTGPSGGGGSLGDECRVVVVFPQELDSGACVRRLFAAGVLLGVDNGCIGAMGL